MTLSCSISYVWNHCIWIYALLIWEALFKMKVGEAFQELTGNRRWDQCKLGTNIAGVALCYNKLKEKEIGNLENSFSCQIWDNFLKRHTMQYFDCSLIHAAKLSGKETCNTYIWSGVGEKHEDTL